MKKLSKCLLLLLITAALFCFTACNQGTDDGAVNPDEAGQSGANEEDAGADDLVRLTMATGNASGAYYPYGAVLAKVVQDKSDYIYISVAASESAADNIQMLENGDAHLAIIQNDILDYAFHGTNGFTTPVTELATLATLYPENCQIIVRADSEIASVADLKEKQVALGELGSGTAANALQILAAYDLTPEDLTPHYISFTAAAEGLKERTIDAFFLTAGTPNTAVMDLAANCDLRLIPLAEEQLTALLERHPFYSKVTLTANDYSFLTEDIPTVAVKATLVCKQGLDEAVAHDIVQAIMDGREDIASSHVKGMFLSPEYALAGVSVELHPGAARYYRTAGVLPAEGATAEPPEEDDGSPEDTGAEE